MRCTLFDGFQMPDVGDGEVRWRLMGYDDAGREVELTTFFWTERPPGESDDELHVTKTKSDGSITSVPIKNSKGKKHGDIDKIRWDTRRGSNEVQAEVRYTDGTWGFSEWVDPPPAGFAGFDLTISFGSTGEEAGEVVVSATEGAEVHTEGGPPPEPLLIDDFSEPKLTAMFPHWLVQTRDADEVVIATVAQVGNIVDLQGAKDDRPRLRVDYFLDETLMGTAPQHRFTVYHALDSRRDARRFRVGDPLILYLLRGEASGAGTAPRWYWDMDSPTGVLDFDPQNLAAVNSRIDTILGRSAQ